MVEIYLFTKWDTVTTLKALGRNRHSFSNTLRLYFSRRVVFLLDVMSTCRPQGGDVHVMLSLTSGTKLLLFFSLGIKSSDWPTSLIQMPSKCVLFFLMDLAV